MSPEQRKSVTDYFYSHPAPGSGGTLASIGLTKEQVRKALGTAPAQPSKNFAVRGTRYAVAVYLPVIEAMLNKILGGHRFTTPTILELADKICERPHAARMYIYNCFGTINPPVEKLREYIKGAKARLKEGS
jgi:hypothetical protein